MTKLIDLTDFNSIGIFKKYRTFIFLSCTLLLGVLIGAWSINLNSDESIYGISSIIKYFTVTAKTQQFYDTFLFSLIKYIPLLTLFYIFGTCSFGNIFVFIMMFIKGFSVGVVSGYFYSTYALTGIGFFALIILPGTFVYLFGLILAARDSIKLSVVYFKLILPGSTCNQIVDEFRKYSVNYIFYLSASIFAAIIDTLMQSAFIGYFNF